MLHISTNKLLKIKNNCFEIEFVQKIDKWFFSFTTNFQLRNLSFQKIPIYIGPHKFGCPYCTKIMKLSRDIRKHILVHTGEKPFSCDLCPYVSNQKGNLKVHKNKYHKQQLENKCLEVPSKQKSLISEHSNLHRSKTVWLSVLSKDHESPSRYEKTYQDSYRRKTV